MVTVKVPDAVVAAKLTVTVPSVPIVAGVTALVTPGTVDPETVTLTITPAVPVNFNERVV